MRIYFSVTSGCIFSHSEFWCCDFFNLKFVRGLGDADLCIEIASRINANSHGLRDPSGKMRNLVSEQYHRML